MNIFEYALRNRLRFDSIRGPITVEELFMLPLEDKGGFDLNSVAKATNSKLKTEGEENFVKPVASTKTKPLEISMEIIRFVISDKLETIERNKQREARNAERKELIGALADKEKEALIKLTPAQIKKRLEALDEKVE